MTGPRLRTTARGSPIPSFASVRGPLLQRKCACGGTPGPTGECEKCRKKKLQRRPGNPPNPLSNSHSSEVPPIVHEVLRSPGQPLDPKTQAFMEPGFGHDFGDVRVHTDTKAAKSASSVNAMAYTVGPNIVFGNGRYTPSTIAGCRLLAHELAHVVQQRRTGPEVRAAGRISEPDESAEFEAEAAASNIMRGAAPALSNVTASGILQRTPSTPPPVASKLFYQEVLDALAVEKKGIITFVQSQMIPDSVPVLEQLIVLCEAINQGATADIPKALDDFLASKTQSLPLSTPSNGLIAEMVTRMLALGLDAETQTLRQWSIGRDKQISPGFHQGFSQEIFMWERIEEQLLQQIPETDGTAALRSLDTLLLFFKQLHRERVSLNPEEIAKDEKRRAELFDNYFVQRDRTIAVYAAELMRLLRETFIGIQTAFQVLLDQAAEDLAQGRGGAMLQNAKDRLENKLQGLIEPQDVEQRVTAVPVETTRSEFKAGGGVHFDYFAKTEAARKKRSVKIEFYDREQLPELASEMKSDFGGVFLVRRHQIELLEEIYGQQKDDKGNLTSETKENAAAIANMGATGMRLQSDDDWRRFVKEKFELREATEGPEKALFAVIVLLEKYLRVFTTHTPYNIDDFGDNLLTKTFPRDLAGRLIHDCGVYALRVAYILSLLRDHPKLRLRFRYAVMPLHVGLVITGDNLPVLLVNNDAITRYPAAFVDELKAEWNQLDETGEKATPARPATEARFAGELMSDAFIPGVDLPYKLVDVAKPAGSPATMKAQLWQQYTRAVAPSADRLFGPSVKDPKSPNYQFYLRYLKLLGLLKDHHNQSLVPFWNGTARQLWAQHKDKITQAFTAWQQAAVDKKVAMQRAYDDLVKIYTDPLDAAFAEVQATAAPIAVERAKVQSYIAEHPEVFAGGTEVESADRVQAMFEAVHMMGAWWEDKIYDHLRDLRSGFRIEAPFAKPEDMILPIN